MTGQPPPYVASVLSTATQAPTTLDSSHDAPNEESLARIKKCLDRAYGAGASELEAKIALRVASRLMEELNVTQADVLAHKTPEERKQHGGQSVVLLKHRNIENTKRFQEAYWLGQLAAAMEIFFDCKSYSQRRSTQPDKYEVVFYGIAANTVAAANAFCMVYNLMVEWARPYRGATGKNSYCNGVSKELRRTGKIEKRAEEQHAKQVELDAIQARIAREAAERQSQVDRLADGPPSVLEARPLGNILHNDPRDPGGSPTSSDSGLSIPAKRIGEDGIRDDRSENADDVEDEEEEWEGWNGFSDDQDDCSDDDEELRPIKLEDLTEDGIDAHIDNLLNAVKTEHEHQPDVSAHGIGGPEPQSANDHLHEPVAAQANSGDASSDSGNATHAAAEWKSHGQLVMWRRTAQGIADAVLEESNIKLYSGRKRKAPNHDWAAYDAGVRDSKRINVRMKSIEDDHEDPPTVGETTLYGPKSSCYPQTPPSRQRGGDPRRHNAGV